MYSTVELKVLFSLQINVNERKILGPPLFHVSLANLVFDPSIFARVSQPSFALFTVLKIIFQDETLVFTFCFANHFTTTVNLYRHGVAVIVKQYSWPYLQVTRRQDPRDFQKSRRRVAPSSLFSFVPRYEALFGTRSSFRRQCPRLFRGGLHWENERASACELTKIKGRCKELVIRCTWKISLVEEDGRVVIV